MLTQLFLIDNYLIFTITKHFCFRCQLNRKSRKMDAEQF